MSASTSATMRRTTLPLPCRASLATMAPASAATFLVSSVELLSKTKTLHEGRLLRNAPTTPPIVAASLKHGTITATEAVTKPFALSLRIGLPLAQPDQVTGYEQSQQPHSRRQHCAGHTGSQM